MGRPHSGRAPGSRGRTGRSSPRAAQRVHEDAGGFPHPGRAGVGRRQILLGGDELRGLPIPMSGCGESRPCRSRADRSSPPPRSHRPPEQSSAPRRPWSPRTQGAGRGATRYRCVTAGGSRQATPSDPPPRPAGTRTPATDIFRSDPDEGSASRACTPRSAARRSPSCAPSRPEPARRPRGRPPAPHAAPPGPALAGAAQPVSVPSNVTFAVSTVPALRPGALCHDQYRLVWAMTCSGAGAPYWLRSSVVCASPTSVTS